MHSKQIQAEINHLMETLNEQYEAVNSHQGSVPRIEIDLMRATLRNLYEQLHRLGTQQNKITSPPVEENYVNNTPPVQPSNVTEEPNPKPVFEFKADEIQEVRGIQVAAEPLAEVSVPIIETIIEEKTEVKTEPVMRLKEVVLKEEVQALVKTEKTVQKKTVHTAGLFDEVTTVAETYTVKTTLHDKMSSGKADRSVADHLQSKPLTDLKKSIGINEKFVFVNELFEGNHSLFNQSIDKLNAFTAYDQARKHLFEELAGQMKWNTDGKAFSELSDLVRRRFNG